MLRHLRRLLPLAAAVLVLSTAAAPASASDLSVADAERYVLTLLNQQRQAHGGVLPLRLDARVASIAKQRSADMAKYHYFDHKSHDGRYAWDMMSDAGITWYWAGEIIAWNNWSTLRESAEAASTGWHNSAPHYEILTSADYNYFGAGYAYDASLGRKIWTVVFLKGPDRTGAWAKLGTSSFTSCSTSSSARYLRYSWSGADYRLQVLTAGLNYFQVERRVDGGSWTWITTSTTATSRGTCVTKGHLYEFRVRARDKAGNVGAWTPALSVRP